MGEINCPTCSNKKTKHDKMPRYELPADSIPYGGVIYNCYVPIRLKGGDPTDTSKFTQKMNMETDIGNFGSIPCPYRRTGLPPPPIGPPPATSPDPNPDKRRMILDRVFVGEAEKPMKVELELVSGICHSGEHFEAYTIENMRILRFNDLEAKKDELEPAQVCFIDEPVLADVPATIGAGLVAPADAQAKQAHLD